MSLVELNHTCIIPPAVPAARSFIVLAFEFFSAILRSSTLENTRGDVKAQKRTGQLCMLF